MTKIGHSPARQGFPLLATGALEGAARTPLSTLLRMLFLALCCCVLGHTQAAPSDANATPLHLGDGQAANLAQTGRLFLATPTDPDFPAADADLPAWLAQQRPAATVDLLGGSYWLYAELRNDGSDSAWVLDPNDTLIERVDARLYEVGGGATTLHTGYQRHHPYLLHYGRDIELQPGATYHVLLHFSSRYYARTPVFSVLPRQQYESLVAKENFLIIGSLGALLALALFNLFIYSITRERASIYYSLYVLTYGAAWGLTFHVGTDMLGWHRLEWHYVPFFLLPVLSTLFYRNFLRLAEFAPRLAQLSRINLVLPLLLLPSCFLFLSYAHTLATLVIMIWMTLALVCGIVVWRRGYQPARFFVLAFIALMLPGLVILPANVGLIPAVVQNAQLWTLLGGTLDGLLLAFALGDQLRLLRHGLEQRVRERTAELTHSNAALVLAKEHAEVVSRHRIDFLSAMSHDIRTPLAGVIGMFKFALRDRSVRGRTHEYLTIGLHNGVALLAILNDILDLSKIDAGKLTLETVDFDLHDLLGDACGILQGQADAKGLLLRRDVAPDLPQFMLGDPTRLRQILINLLGNAVKFTASGEVRLQVDSVAAAGGALRLTLRISDTGPGIDADMLPRLFRKFEQADQSTTRRYGGTGLGLAICKELVELMGGTIGVNSVAGAGTCFTVALPLVAGQAPPASPTPATPRHAYQLRVLCAEDVRTNQIIIATLLEGMGHHCDIVANGVEALGALASTPYDVVLMDGRMPVLDGPQATRLIRAGGGPEYPGLDRTIPIIALTANASEHDRALYLAAGMDGFLSKPIDEQLLYEQLEHCITRLLDQGRVLAPAVAAPAPPDDDDLARQFGVAPAAATADTADMADTAIRFLPLAGMSPAHAQRIVDAFVQEAPGRLERASCALDNGDGEAASAAFHALKGSAGYFSPPTVHQLSHELERLAAAGQLEQARAHLPALRLALEQTCAGLRALAPAAPS